LPPIRYFVIIIRMKSKLGYKKTHIRSGTIFFISLVLFFAAGNVRAMDSKPTIRDEAYAAKYVSQSIADPIEIEAGTVKWIKVNFKNVGIAAWDNEGSRHISAYTMEPRDRESVFYGAGGWKSPKQIGRMVGTIKPGETGEFGIPLYAPAKIGEYTEEFYLAAENWTWVKGGYFFLDIKVVPKTEEAASDVDESETGPPAGGLKFSRPALRGVAGETENDANKDDEGSYQANRFILNKKSVTAAGGERVKIILGFQNLGTATWNNFSISAGTPTTLASLPQKISLADDTWQDPTIIVSKDKIVEPSGILRQEFYFRAPAKVGNYTAEFVLSVDGKSIHTVSIPVTVTSDAPSYVENQIIPQEEIFKPRLAEEPRLRVGLWQKPEINTVQFVSYEDDYDVFAGIENRGRLGKIKIGILTYAGGVYSFKGGGINFRTNDYIRLSPASNPHAVFTLYNWTRNVGWKGQGNFNKYRGAMELRIGEINPDLWVVNDLLLEDYMKGVAENANTSPIEYLKAQSAAQRSYAYYTKQSDKYGIFDLVATTGDQLYLGYNSEGLLSNFVTAVEATRGYMATYDIDSDASTPNEVVITPYYANSDGRTRSWKEVWGGANKAWLVSVTANYDIGRKMYGHGVGMSQLDASARAKAEGLTWQELVKYYYKGVEVERIYE